MKVLLATSNRHKVSEILQIWGDVPFEILTLNDFPEFPPVVEDGHTFEANSLKKAREAARFSGLISVSDDSGIEVDALNGRPGVHSARFAGSGATDEDNNLKLLQELKTIPLDSPLRKARFRCVAALVSPRGDETIVNGVVEGRVIDSPRGSHGFGYDPLFFVPEKGKTTAEMTSIEKHAISHRAKAFRKLKEILLQILQD